jgi:uncharacterized protein (TIGR02246 family)
VNREVFGANDDSNRIRSGRRRRRLKRDAPELVASSHSRELTCRCQRHDAATCAALFTDDGVIISPWAPPARGPDAIRATHQTWFDEGEATKRLTVLEAKASGDLAYCLLAWSGDYPQSDGSIATYSGTSVNVLQRHAKGDWKIQVQSLNSDAK